MKRSLSGRILVVVVIGALVFGILRIASCGGLRVGTYNIRQFGKEATDMDRLTAIIAATNADVLAVQEIQSEERMRELARRLSTGKRRYAFRLSACGGRSAMRVGLLYDEARVELRSTREYPELDPDGRGTCSDGDRPGFSAELSDRRSSAGMRTWNLLVVHLVAGSEPADLARRKDQWRRAHRIAKDLGKNGPVMMLGDTNSTGFLDDKAGERTFIEEEARNAELDVVTRGLGCSEYWNRGGRDGGPLEPSLLDHAVASPGFAVSRSAKVHGFCRELACAPAPRAPEEYVRVSDHCPVTLDLTR